MKRFKHLHSLITLLLLIAFVPQSYADISSSALLYLRIAPGARAAGMGEAYVAVSDDATSTHWNPAGLGASPLSTNWQNKNIPSYLRPIKEMTTIKARGGSGHNQFDIWTISAQGLARFDNHSWFTFEVFSTKTNQTVAGIVKNYFSIKDDKELNIALAKVARTNSLRSFEDVENFSTSILKAVPEDYSDREALVVGLDSLKELYFECRINWSRFIEIEKIYKDGFKDSSLTNKEIDRINFAVEKAKTRFIPENLKIKYSSLFSGKLTTIKSIGSTLLIGTENGFYTFNGSKWRTYTEADGLPSMNILSISSVGSTAFIGTDNGLVKYSGRTLTPISLPDKANEGSVTGLGASNSSNIWAVINGEMYHFDGNKWANSYSYTAVIDDTYEIIAEKISIFQNKSEILQIAQSIKDLNKVVVNELEVAEIISEDSLTSEQVSDSETELIADNAQQDSLLTTHVPGKFTIEPGKPVMVPYGVGIKGEINKIFSIGNKVWIATDYGLYSFKNGEWKASGYKSITVTAGQTLVDITTDFRHPILDSDEYIKLLADINGIDADAVLTDGQVIKVFSNPLAYKINDINQKPSGLYIATKRGLYELQGSSLSKVDIGGMGNSNILSVKTHGDEIWFASDNKIAIKASGRADIVIMFAKWLPELADDIYYGFLSGTSDVGGIGTFGFNVTYINYGTVNRTDASGNPNGTFEPFDISFGGSFGGSLRGNLKGGVSLKLLISHLSRLGAGIEQGTGTATGLAIDLGLLWNVTKRFDIGLAVTNLGPDISYIDAAQSDPLPRNFALGFKANLLSSEYYNAIITAEVNKSLVGLNDGFSEEIKQLVVNGGFEFSYLDIFAVRAGYIWDDEGAVKTPTIGFGIAPVAMFKLDFAYIPSSDNLPLSNTLRTSMRFVF